MPGVSPPPSQVPGPDLHRAGWLHLGRRFLLAALIFLFMSLNLPGGGIFALVPVTLLLWGGLLVAYAAHHLFDLSGGLRATWLGLAVGAYLALAVPMLVKGPQTAVEAFPAVVALALVPHLGRRDLGSALHDWAVIVSLAIFAGLSVQAMWVLVSSLGLGVFFILSVVPSLLFEALLLLGRRRGGGSRGYAFPLLLASAATAGLVSITQFNRAMVPGWLIVFALLIGVLIGAGLLLTYLTRHLAEAASGAREGAGHTMRSLVELSHGPMIISLALYLPVSLLR